MSEALLWLAQGPLDRAGNGQWHFRGRRLFNQATVAESTPGEAERAGDQVVVRRALQNMS
jgi:hypothetical protein